MKDQVLDPVDQLKRMKESADFIRSVAQIEAGIGIILGSGLGGFAAQVDIEKEIPYTDIPHFPVSTVQGHGGKLIVGRSAGKQLLIMSGRFHFYEGYSSFDVVFPIRVMQQLGVKTLFVSNAAGGVNPGFEVGDLMVIKDHVSFSIVNPLIGKNIDELGPRFPDMSEPYSKHLISKAFSIADELGIDLKQGVYYGVTGPTFETRAEYKLIHVLGADAVGMSTVQEVIVAVHAGMQVFAVSVITDMGIREEENVITHQEVLDAAKNAEPKLTALLKKMIETL